MFLWVLLACFFFLTTVIISVFCIKFALTILRIEEVLEKSLDSIDERYTSIDRILQIPMFSDSAEIRKVHEDIKATRDSLLQVAEAMSKGVIGTDDEPDEGSQT